MLDVDTTNPHRARNGRVSIDNLLIVGDQWERVNHSQERIDPLVPGP